MDRIGRYRLVRRLGAGSFATVWLGRDDDLQVDVAVKILADNWSTNSDVRNRFLAEARLMRRIRDERIVRVYDIGTLPDGRPYFVMDYCNAGSLNDLRRSPGDPARTLRLCAEACRALDVLHRHQVVHRDVTPGNLLLDSNPDGSVRVLLADLGVAKEMVGQQGATMTAGTPAFMAPEQATGRALGPRSDIYAMGCVTYAVLTGRSPFAVKSVSDVIARSADEKPAPLAASVGAPPHLDGLLEAALSVDPDRRPPTADVMARALDQIVDAMTGRPASHVERRFGPQVPGVGQAWSGSPAQPGGQSYASPGTAHPSGIQAMHGTQSYASPGTAHPAGIQAMHGTQRPAPTTPAWQFWTLVGLIAVLVFLGVMFLVLVAI